jgi:hypothetical protein
MKDLDESTIDDFLEEKKKSEQNQNSNGDSHKETIYNKPSEAEKIMKYILGISQRYSDSVNPLSEFKGKPIPGNVRSNGLMYKMMGEVIKDAVYDTLNDFNTLISGNLSIIGYEPEKMPGESDVNRCKDYLRKIEKSKPNTYKALNILKSKNEKKVDNLILAFKAGTVSLNGEVDKLKNAFSNGVDEGSAVLYSIYSKAEKK